MSSKIAKQNANFIKNLNLQLKLSQMGVDSWNGTEEKNRVINTPYDVEMIEAYKDQGKMNEISTIQPPSLDAIPPATTDRIDKIKADIEATKKLIVSDIDLLKLVNANIDRNKTKFNKILQERNDLEALINSGQAAPTKKDQIITYDKNLKDLKADIARSKKTNDQKNMALAERRDTLQKLEEELTALEDDVTKLNQKNQSEIQQYKNSLKISDDSNTQPLPNETEDAYIQRLQDIANLSNGSYIKTKAYLSNIEKFKNNFKQLTRNDVFIQQVLNSIQSEPDGDGRLFELNKRFPIFKEDYLKVFGYNNYNVSLSEAMAMVDDFINNDKLPSFSLNNLTSVPILLNNADVSNVPLIQPPPSLSSKNATDVYATIQNNMLELERNGKKIFIKWATIPQTKKSYVFLSDTGDVGSFLSTDDRPHSEDGFYKLLKNKLGVSDSDIFQFFQLPNSKKLKHVNKDVVLQILKDRYGLTDSYDSNDIFDVQTTGKHSIYGMGIKNGIEPLDINKVVPFGLVMLFLHKLYYKNMLSIQNKKGFKIPGFKNTPVSDAFVNCIMKILDDKELTANDMHNLKSPEKYLLDNLLHVAGLHKKNITSTSKETISNLKQRLTLVEGEIQAGNTNDELKKELYELLFKLYHFHCISERQARNHYKDIVKQFF